MTIASMDNNVEGGVRIDDAEMASQVGFLLRMMADMDATAVGMQEMLDLASGMEDESTSVALMGMF
jgi:hypothetical protein